MATIGTITTEDSSSIGLGFLRYTQSAALDAAAEETDKVLVDGLLNHTATYTVNSVGTNVVVIVWGSMDGTNWTAISSDTRTANGTYHVTNSNPWKYLKVELDSISGGTPTVNPVYITSYNKPNRI